MSPTLLSALPTVNAVLNGTSAVLLFTGYLFIRRRKVTAHKICMLSAFVTSMVFLMSYLTLRYFAGFTAFQGEGWIRPVYFAILISHTILAATIPPLALTILYRAFREQFISLPMTRRPSARQQGGSSARHRARAILARRGTKLAKAVVNRPFSCRAENRAGYPSKKGSPRHLSSRKRPRILQSRCPSCDCAGENSTASPSTM